MFMSSSTQRSPAQASESHFLLSMEAYPWHSLCCKDWQFNLLWKALCCYYEFHPHCQLAGKASSFNIPYQNLSISTTNTNCLMSESLENRLWDGDLHVGSVWGSTLNNQHYFSGVKSPELGKEKGWIAMWLQGWLCLVLWESLELGWLFRVVLPWDREPWLYTLVFTMGRFPLGMGHDQSIDAVSKSKFLKRNSDAGIPKGLWVSQSSMGSLSGTSYYPQ